MNNAVALRVVDCDRVEFLIIGNEDTIPGKPRLGVAKRIGFPSSLSRCERAGVNRDQANGERLLQVTFLFFRGSLRPTLLFACERIPPRDDVVRIFRTPNSKGLPQRRCQS